MEYQNRVLLKYRRIAKPTRKMIRENHIKKLSRSIAMSSKQLNKLIYSISPEALAALLNEECN